MQHFLFSFIRHLWRGPWTLMENLLMRTDEDYWRMVHANRASHSARHYWDFVQQRRMLEQQGRYNRRDLSKWDKA